METKHTPGPWQVITEIIPHYLGEHTSRRIFTGWDHPQMKGPLPVAGVSIGVGKEKGGPAVQFCCISEPDAALMSAAPVLLAALQECETYLSERDDVVDGDYGQPAPNAEMTLLCEVRAAIAKATGKCCDV